MIEMRSDKDLLVGSEEMILRFDVEWSFVGLVINKKRQKGKDLESYLISLKYLPYIENYLYKNTVNKSKIS